jgi:hypothetical protein
MLDAEQGCRVRSDLGVERVVKAIQSAAFPHLVYAVTGWMATHTGAHSSV